MCFHTNCEVFCSSSVKNAIGNLIAIALSLEIAFGSLFIFTILILPTQEHGISLHLFLSSLISFISVLLFSVYSSFVTLGKFIPRYLIIFVAVVNGIDSLIFDALKLWCWRRLFRVPWTAERSNQSFLKETNTEYSLEGLTLTLKLQGILWLCCVKS